jgi:predicted RNA-binding Zn ribbon-like protein
VVTFIPLKTTSSTTSGASTPGPLATLVDFLNTLDPDTGEEAFDSSLAVAAWLAEHGLIRADVELGPRDRARTVRFREALRDLVAGNAGAAIPAASIERLNGVGARARLAPVLDSAGRIRAATPAAGLADALGALLVVVGQAQAEGTWPRMKVCQAQDCRRAFYDRSRNRSASWCSMAVCGSRVKMRRYRRRNSTGSG